MSKARTTVHISRSKYGRFGKNRIEPTERVMVGDTGSNSIMVQTAGDGTFRSMSIHTFARDDELSTYVTIRLPDGTSREYHLEIRQDGRADLVEGVDCGRGILEFKHNRVPNGATPMTQ